MLFTAVVGTMGAIFVYHLSETDQVSPDLELPRWIVFLCVPLGSYLNAGNVVTRRQAAGPAATALIIRRIGFILLLNRYTAT
jgi:hypothetical protein